MGRRCRLFALAGLAGAATAAVATTALLGRSAALPPGAHASGAVRLTSARVSTRCAGRIVVVPGAATRLGLDAAGVPAPAWSGIVGTVDGVVGDDVVTETGRDCVAAVNASRGRVLWTSAVRVPGSQGIEGATAGPGVVVVGESRTFGKPRAMVYDAVDGLVGLDARTGRRLWTLALAPDGQQLPAVVQGSTVVVSKPDGVVEGIRATSGAVSWSDPLPAGCGSAVPGARRPLADSSPLTPRASVIAGGPPSTVLYRCGTDDEIAAIDPRSGRRRWTWRAWGLVMWQAREVIGETTPSPAGDGVVAVGEPTAGPLAVPSRTWSPGSQPAESYDVVVLDQQTGRPLWVLRGVPTPATGAEPDVAVVDGRVCVGHAAAVECWSARTGAPAWSWSAPENASSTLADRMPGLAVSGSDLYLAVPTAAAAAIDPQSTTERSAPGTFVLVGLRLSDGAVASEQGLPSYYGGGHIVVVSDTNPPEVRAEVGGAVVVSPEAGADLVEAIRP